MEDVTNLTAGHYGMVIVLPIFIILAILAYQTTPREWRQSKREKAMIIIFNVCGLLVLYGLTTWFCEVPDSWLRWIINYFQTCYFDFLLILPLTLTIIGCIYAIYRKIRGDKAHKWNYRAIWLCVFAAVLCFAFVSIYHDKTVMTTEYTTTNTKTQPEQDMKIVMYADSHMGAGADKATLSYATDIVNTADPDILILDGDLVDGTTSQSDLEALTATLKNADAKYGKYFVMGNHDDNCLYDFEKALTDAGVTILRDEAVRLPNGAILVGKNDSTNIMPSEIMSNASISEEEQKNSYIILAQHRPQRAEQYKTQVDLMLCGHTHGNHFPKVNPLSFLSDRLNYGDRYYDNMYAITTSGLASWGFHTKWPSYSEVVIVNITH